MRVRFTPQAERQYLVVLAYVFDRSPAGAATFQRRAEAVIAQLREHPHSGRAIPEFAELPHLELPGAPLRFFHRVVGDTVWIVAVWHARQSPAEPEG